ncbi:MAG: putative toxin-antitoxin system toxin component, PIN family [Bacteroidota bacterium]
MDTNVLISALLSRRSVPAEAVARAQQHGDLLLSDATLGELAEVLSRPKFERYVTRDERDRFLAALVARATWVEVDVEVTASRDPKDDMFLALAVAGGARAVVTGDRDLLVLGTFSEVQILDPASFVTILSHGEAT